MNTTYDQRAKQTLSLTPRLQQSVKLLQLSSQEFVQEIHHALANNPFLEEEEHPAGELDERDDNQESAISSADDLMLNPLPSAESLMLERQSGEIADEPAFETYESSYDADEQPPSQDYESDSI